MSQLGDISNQGTKFGYKALRMKSPSMNADIDSEMVQGASTTPLNSMGNNKTSTMAVKSETSFVQKVDTSQPYYTKNAGDEINAFTPLNNQTGAADKAENMMLLQDPAKVSLEKENLKMKNEARQLQSLVKFYKTKYLQIKH